MICTHDGWGGFFFEIIKKSVGSRKLYRFDYVWINVIFLSENRPMYSSVSPIRFR